MVWSGALNCGVLVVVVFVGYLAAVLFVRAAHVKILFAILPKAVHRNLFCFGLAESDVVADSG